MKNRPKIYVVGDDRSIHCDEECKTCYYVYADGILCRKAGYDITKYPVSEGFDFKHDRVEEVIAVLPDGEEIDSVLFFWHHEAFDEDYKREMERDPVLGCHGLVVASYDPEHRFMAEQAFNELRCFA